MIHSKTGSEIQRQRERLGLSRAQLADAIGVGRQAVYQYETGQRKMTVIRWCLIAKVLGQDAGRMLSRALG